MKHPKISEAAVAGLPHAETGEVVKAWIALAPGSSLTPEQIIEWAQNNMTHYKRPGLVELIAEVPKDLIGKVQRRFLQTNDPIWKEKYGENA
jgi:long-chain acyl-CoA synthetase